MINDMAQNVVKVLLYSKEILQIKE